jgi:selenocysteine lyase/cysteine desulfurase
VTEDTGEKAKKLSDAIIDLIMGHERVVAISALTGVLGMAIAHDVATVEELVKRRDAVVAMLEDVIESAWHAKAKGSGQHLDA